MAGPSLIKAVGLKGAQYNALQTLAGTGLSIADITKIVNGLNPLVDINAVQQVVTSLRAQATASKYIKSVNVGKRMDLSKIPYSVTTQRNDFSYWVNVTVRDNVTGTTQTMVKKLATNEWYPIKDDAVAAYVDEWENDESNYDHEFISGSVFFITRNSNG